MVRDPTETVPAVISEEVQAAGEELRGAIDAVAGEPPLLVEEAGPPGQVRKTMLQGSGGLEAEKDG